MDDTTPNGFCPRLLAARREGKIRPEPDWSARKSTFAARRARAGAVLLFVRTVPSWSRNGRRRAFTAALDCFNRESSQLTPLVLLADGGVVCAGNSSRQKSHRAAGCVVRRFFSARSWPRFVLHWSFTAFCASAAKCFHGVLVPFYVAVWSFSSELGQQRPHQGVGCCGVILADFISLVSSLPFWLASWYWSRNLYAALPDKAPADCFLVTRLVAGYVKFVGPYFEIERSGYAAGTDAVDQPRVTFLKAFENLWRGQFPHSHALIRNPNRVGQMTRASAVAGARSTAQKPGGIPALWANAGTTIERPAKQKPWPTNRIGIAGGWS